jgi:hypothetical protein
MDPRSTVGLLEPCAGTAPTELLRLAAPGVGDEEGAVVAREDVLDLLLGGLVDVLLEVRDERLGDGLADGVDLRRLPPAADADAHVDLLEPAAAGEHDWLERLEPEHLRPDQLDRHAVHLDEPAPGLGVRDRHSRLLAAETLHGASSRASEHRGHGCGKRRGRRARALAAWDGRERRQIFYTS